MKFEQKRYELVKKLQSEGIISSENVINAMLTIPRHKFVPESIQNSAYLDAPLAIGYDQTISAPHMHGMMCEYLDIQMGMKILEVGTGSGYHTALLSYLVGEKGKVFSVERIKELSERAQKIFEELEYFNIITSIDDGTMGWPKNAPFDRILITAASPTIGQPYIDQLSDNHGKLCIPIGNRVSHQKLMLCEKIGNKVQKSQICGVRFVPLIGKYGFNEK